MNRFLSEQVLPEQVPPSCQAELEVLPKSPSPESPPLNKCHLLSSVQSMYDDANRLEEVVDPEQGVTSYVHDQNGNLSCPRCLRCSP